MRRSPLEPFIDLYRPAVAIALNPKGFRSYVDRKLDILRESAYPSLPETTVKSAQRTAFFCMDKED